MPSYYIHLDDPGFPDPPWPGQRRLGPYLTEEEALAQAVSDAATGMGVPAGVFSEAESEKMRDGGKGKAAHTRAKIRDRAVVVARERHDERIRAKQEDVDALATILPDSIDPLEVIP